MNDTAQEEALKEDDKGDGKAKAEGDDGDVVDTNAAAKGGSAMTGLQVMAHLQKLEPETPFVIKYMEKTYEGVLDLNVDKPGAVLSDGQRCEECPRGLEQTGNHATFSLIHPLFLLHSTGLLRLRSFLPTHSLIIHGWDH